MSNGGESRYGYSYIYCGGGWPGNKEFYIGQRHNNKKHGLGRLCEYQYGGTKRKKSYEGDFENDVLLTEIMTYIMF